MCVCVCVCVAYPNLNLNSFPLKVVHKRQEFYDQAASQGCLAVVYDIPLLLEQRAKHQVDYVLVVTASTQTQRQRVLKRPLMTPEKFDVIMKKQMPDAEKRQMADFVIDTDYPGMCSVLCLI